MAPMSRMQGFQQSMPGDQPGSESTRIQWPGCTAGLGLRREHYAHILGGQKIRTNWFEAITENYLDSQGRPRAILRRIREQYPLALHGVSLSIASADSNIPSPRYLRRWKELIQEIQPFLVSDHLCWTRSGEIQSHDLLPVCYDEEWLLLVCENLDRVQNFLGTSIALENVSSYISWKSSGSEIPEWQFLNEVCHRTGCGLLLDINNVCVNSHNHGFSAEEFVDSIDPAVVWQYHVAGHSLLKSLRFDTHGQPMQKEVRDLFYRARQCIGPRPVLLERDQDIPEFSELEDELVSLESPDLRTQIPEARGRSLPIQAWKPTSLQIRDRIGANQKSFLSALFSGRAPSSLADQLRGAGDPRLDEIQSLDVYRQSALARLEEALEELFAPLKGFSKYEDWMRSYIEKNTPATHNLSDYGHGMAAALVHTPVASEVARACILYQRFFHGQRPGGNWIADAGTFHDVALFSMSEQAAEIWEAYRNGIEQDRRDAGRPAEGSEDSGQRSAGTRIAMLLFRSPSSADGTVRVRRLQPFEAGVLVRLMRRQSLEQTMEWLAYAFAEVEENQVRDFFQFLVTNGLYQP